MFSVTRQLVTHSSNFETGAVTGLSERRKLCLRSANLRQALQRSGRAVLEGALNCVSRRAKNEPFDDGGLKDHAVRPAVLCYCWVRQWDVTTERRIKALSGNRNSCGGQPFESKEPKAAEHMWNRVRSK
jgi:hypothetical protein